MAVERNASAELFLAEMFVIWIKCDVIKDCSKIIDNIYKQTLRLPKSKNIYNMSHDTQTVTFTITTREGQTVGRWS